MPTIFSRIINKEIPAHVILEDDQFIAFLDISPLVIGHTLVVPKKEVDYIFDNDDDTLSKIMIFAKKVAKAIDKSIPCRRVGVAVIGLEVPHTHVHLVPLNSMRDINFMEPKIHPTQEQLAETAAKIKAKL